MPDKNRSRSIIASLSVIFLGVLIFQSCTLPVETKGSNIITPPPSPNVEAEVVFRVEIPFQNGNQILYLDILDETTGLALNPVRHTMNQDDNTHFSIHLSATKGSFLKYRYLKGGELPLVEHNALGQQVRYRSYYVDGPAEINDIVAGWQDLPFQGAKGRLSGQVLDEQTGTPLGDMIVSTGGYQATTRSDGIFEINHLPVGTHIVTVFSKNGDYQPFQQGATIAEDSLTTATIRMKKLNLVNVRFNLTMPQNFKTTLPIRMVGNIASLGNTFDDLMGGVNVLANEAPIMQETGQDGKFFLSLKLPTGLDLRYKYTLGDGFWNAELDSSGRFRIRQLIVPDHDIVVEDAVTSWRAPGTEAITFTLLVPEGVPSPDVIAIQFNPFGWMEPVPMIHSEENRWSYTLYSPLNLIKRTYYRYCINNRCETESGASLTEPREFMPSSTPQTFFDTIDGWK